MLTVAQRDRRLASDGCAPEPRGYRPVFLPVIARTGGIITGGQMRDTDTLPSISLSRRNYHPHFPKSEKICDKKWH